MTGFYVDAPVSFPQGLATFADEIRPVQPTLFFPKRPIG